MKIVKQKELNLKNAQVQRNVRSDLATQIKKYWVGKPNSNIGMQYLQLNSGIISVARSFERRDLFVIYVDQACNLFIEPDGSVQIDAYEGIEFTDVERMTLTRYAKKVYVEQHEYVARELRFFAEKPWLQVHGMAPEQAVAKFAELGWGPREEENN